MWVHQSVYSLLLTSKHHRWHLKLYISPQFCTSVAQSADECLWAKITTWSLLRERETIEYTARLVKSWNMRWLRTAKFWTHKNSILNCPRVLDTKVGTANDCIFAMPEIQVFILNIPDLFFVNLTPNFGDETLKMGTYLISLALQHFHQVLNTWQYMTVWGWGKNVKFTQGNCALLPPLSAITIWDA